MNKALKIGLFVLLVGSVVTLLAFINSRPKRVNCEQIDVTIDYSEDHFFITEAEVIEIIQAYCDANEGHLEKEVKLRGLEKKLMQHPVVKKCDIYTNVNGSMHVEIRQRTPIGRVINTQGDSYYINEDGYMMPIIPGRPSRVVVVNGHIRESYSPTPYYMIDDSAAVISILDEVYAMLAVIDKSEFWKAELEQIHVTESGEFILIPKVGIHEILFGKAEHIEGKLNKLEWFYRKGLPAEGWKTYKTVDVRYKGQVICRGEKHLIDLPVDTVNNQITDTVTVNND